VPRCYQDRALSTMASVMFASEDGFCDSGGDGSEGGSGDEGSGDEGSDDEDGRGRGRGSVRADRDDDDDFSEYLSPIRRRRSAKATRRAGGAGSSKPPKERTNPVWKQVSGGESIEESTLSPFMKRHGDKVVIVSAVPPFLHCYTHPPPPLRPPRRPFAPHVPSETCRLSRAQALGRGFTKAGPWKKGKAGVRSLNGPDLACSVAAMNRRPHRPRLSFQPQTGQTTVSPSPISPLAIASRLLSCRE